MIVSGFTQRRCHIKQPDVAVLSGEHSHCLYCCQTNCSKFVDNVNVCAVVTCQACGWRSHGCKLSEHTLMCPEERVTCLNVEYGCPHMLKRSKMASHLAVCPASVVFCAEEWSRWPMHAREQGVRMPLPQEKHYLDCGQLDVGLAMRDQRMLIDSLRAPRKLRQTLRNPLTQIYPAAPLPYWRSFDSDLAVSEDTSHTVSEDDADAPWDLSKTHPGLKESIRSRLFRVTKETADSLAAALEITSSALSSSQLSEISEAGDGSSLQMIAETKAVKCHPLTRSISSMESNESTDSSVSLPGHTSPLNYAVSQTGKGSSSGVLMDENLKQSDMMQEANSFIDHLDRRSLSSDRCSDISTRSKSTLHDFGGRQLHKLIGCKQEDGRSDEICLHKVLGVSINIECINKYVTKPASMYTFICAQNFRRDEYHWHFKNVHLDIHTGLSGWLEQRCPLANLGCTFSFQRLQPLQGDTVVYHSWLQESFGLHSIMQPTRIHCDNNSSVNSKYCTESALSPLAKLTNDVKLNQIVQNHTPHSGQHLQGISDPGSTAPAALGMNSLSLLDRDNSVSHDRDNSVSHDRDNSVSLDRDNSVSLDRDNSVPHDRDNSVSLDRDNSVSLSVQPDIHGNANNSNSVDQVLSLENQRTETLADPGALQKVNSEQAGSHVGGQAGSHVGGQAGSHVGGSFMKVQPIIYTASNWDSKVLFQYDMEADSDDELADVTDVYHNFTNLPFEVLRHIARHLDSFSLCNLSLTCHVLRDVCCSLLGERGIVLLNWHREKSEVNGRVSWKVSGQRWMFSTSFEPVHAWRFTESLQSIGEHLKVCPYNKDIIRHTKPFSVLHIT